MHYVMSVPVLESGTSETSDSRFVGECGAILFSVREYLLGPQLPQPEPLVHIANTGT